MNYSGLYITEVIFLLIIALWFARQLKCFSLLTNISDPQGILPPTIVLFIGLFIISYLYHDVSRASTILEIFKSNTPLTAIAIFFLGQYIAKSEQRKEKKEQEKVAGKRILYLLQEFIESDALSKLEKSLNISNPDDSNLEKFKEICTKEIEYFTQKIQEIKTDQSIFNSSYRETLIVYLRRAEKFFKEEIEGQNDYDYESIVMVFYYHKYEAYQHKLYVCKNIIKDNSSLQSNLLLLENDRKKLERWKKRRKKIIEEYKKLEDLEEYKKLEDLKEKYPYLEKYFASIYIDYYEYIEDYLLDIIDKILNEYR